MTGLRTERGLLLYLLVVCCGLLLTSMYVFYDNGLPKWILSSDVDNKGQSSTFKHYINSVKDYNDSEIDFQSFELKSKSFVSDDISLNLESDDIEESTFGADFNSYTNLPLLVDILAKKMTSISIRETKQFKPTCENDFKLANSCDNKKCLQTDLPENLTTRVEQLVMSRSLQMSHEQHEILREMADKVKGNYDIILLTAASSNHFLESQALLKNLHETAFLHLKNFTLIFYNLGLTEQERILMVKYCKCQVIDFPFEKFPNFMKTLKCYSWKPVLIKAHLQKANVVFWMDASIRFHNSASNLHEFIEAARKRGLQIGGSSADSVFRTYRSMYHFFGDEPCAYLKLGQAHATLGVYHREYFVDRVILEPWVACALNEDCICPRNRSRFGCRDSKIVATYYYQGKGRIVYGMCHRYDQSAISIILHKLYQGFYWWVIVRTGSVLSIKRRHTLSYFPQE